MDNLTGKTRFRPYVNDVAVLMVLQVEVKEFATVMPGVMVPKFDWRDASVEDLCELQHLTYSNINVNAKVELPQIDGLPGERSARKLH